jgi:sRNA-binding carbon storage regulator CsrA
MPGLKTTVQAGQQIVIGNTVITVLRTATNYVHLEIDAPKNVEIAISRTQAQLDADNRGNR